MTPPFDSRDALQLFLAQSSNQQFQEALPFFSLTELADSLTLLQSQPVLESHSKLDELFKFIDSPTILESLGKYFSPSLFIGFLNFLMRHPHYKNRLNFILVGIHPLIFSKTMHYLQDDHLRILQQEGLWEPLQYQLTQFIHEGEQLREEIEKNVKKFKQDLLSSSEELNPNTFQSLIDRIDDFKHQLIDYLERASTALAIVWHTERIDLIEKLSSINESLQHQLSQLIGHSAFDDLPPTGLYELLEQTLASIFDSSLKNDDSAIEGMTRLAIWHLKDYWELGLLPSIPNLQELDLDSDKYPENERWNYQHELNTLIQQQLERLGIGKVADLKKFHIFSKSLLKAYIDQHRHLLLEE